MLHLTAHLAHNHMLAYIMNVILSICKSFESPLCVSGINLRLESSLTVSHYMYMTPCIPQHVLWFLLNQLQTSRHIESHEFVHLTHILLIDTGTPHDKLQIYEFLVADSICSSAGLDSFCFVALISTIVCGQFMPADGTRILFGKPWCQTH